MTEARIANDIVLSGHLSFPDGSFYIGTHSTVTMAYNVLIAYASTCVGIDTYILSQAVVAVFSVLTVVGVYVIALRLSNNLTGALAAAFILALLGTFVFLTGSAWKGSLGVSLLVLLTYAYMHRSDWRFFALEIVVLCVLPVTYHLVTVLAYSMLAYLTSWSLLVAIRNKRVTSLHLRDLAVIIFVTVGAYAYYLMTSFKRLSDYGTADNIALTAIIFIIFAIVAAFVFFRKDSLSISFAPYAGAIIAGIVIIDYLNPLFPYTQGYAPTVPVIGVMFAVVVAVGWFGFELLSRSNSKYRQIPLGLLLPVLTLLLLALLTGFNLEGHKTFYRTFDYADISLALAASVTVAHFTARRRGQIMIILLVIVLLCSFPFAYATSTLLGDRHDTQLYEVDALAWIHDTGTESTGLRSDERLSYDARALFDYGKDPYLPRNLQSDILSLPYVMNVLLEEWMITGVNDYPRGHPILDEVYVNSVLESSNVWYVGGPDTNNIIVFQTSAVFCS